MKKALIFGIMVATAVIGVKFGNELRTMDFGETDPPEYVALDGLDIVLDFGETDPPEYVAL